MKTINDGGRAFPCPESENFSPNFDISLRDYFAIHANENDIKYYMRELKKVKCGIDEYIYRTREQAKYAYADAMLKEREE